MKRASYREAIRWIAVNDSAGDVDAENPEVVAELITSVLVADIFGVDSEKVGRDVVRERVHLRRLAADGYVPYNAHPRLQVDDPELAIQGDPDHDPEDDGPIIATVDATNAGEFFRGLAHRGLK